MPNSTKPSPLSALAVAPLAHKVLAYSDGACRGNPGKGGYGTIVIYPDGSQQAFWGGEATTTNNRMELMAVIVCLENTPADKELELWSDSTYVVKGITEWLPKWKKRGWKASGNKPVQNLELWQRLDQACQNRQVNWQWIKGHAGHAGNEYADRLANRGIDDLPTPHHAQWVTVSSQKKPPQSPLDLPSRPTDQITNDPNHPAKPANLAAVVQPSVDDLTMPNMSNDLPMPQPASSLENAAIFNNNPSPFAATHAAAFNHPLMDEAGRYLPQADAVIAERPAFDGNTQEPNHFVPLLPFAKHRGANNRQLILDTETTGLEINKGDRIIEIGIVELVERRFSGEKLHVYINPDRPMDEEAINIHGIHNEFLAGMPRFEQIGQVVFDFLQGAELVAHNASFDIGFLQAEFFRMGLPDITEQVTVVDSLAIAKHLYVGQRNNLDALVKRLNVGKQERIFHGALLDAEILAEVYLAMTGGQVALAIDDDGAGGFGVEREHRRFSAAVSHHAAGEAAKREHQAWLEAMAAKYPMLISRWQELG